MDELVRIKQAVEVDETLLVVDAMAGQEAVNVAKTFNEKVGISGVILTKTDGDTRGGAALSVLAVTGMPIYFQGTGEKLEDLEPFYPARMANRILGMGDVLSLIEKAQTLQNDKEAEAAAKRLMENKFDMNDLLAQFQQVKNDGRCVGAAGHDARRRPDRRRFPRRKGTAPHRGHHLLDDPGRARQARHHQPQAQAPHCSRLRHHGGGCQQAAAPV